MKFLRAIKGYKHIKRLRNVDIRSKLHICSVKEKLAENRIRWNEHLQQMDPERLPLKIKNVSHKEKLAENGSRWY